MERRHVDELIAKYELEPTVRDVFVEGASDKKFVSWVFRESGVDVDVSVLEIESIDIAPEWIRELGVSGNRGRIIALCMEFARWESVSQQASGLVDRDFDSVLGSVYLTPHLVWTDHASLDHYYISREAFATIAPLSLEIENDSGLLWGSIAEVLLEVFAMRAANERLGLGVSFDSFVGKVDVKRGGGISFDSAGLVFDALCRAGHRKAVGDFNRQVRDIRGQMCDDVQRYIRAHDFFELLAYYCRRHCKVNVNSDGLRRIFIGRAEVGKICSSSGIGRLLQRVQV